MQLVRDKLGPVASFKTAHVVPHLPKTRSGKILRGTMRKIADREDYRMPATIEDPSALDDIKTALAGESGLGSGLLSAARRCVVDRRCLDGCRGGVLGIR